MTVTNPGNTLVNLSVRDTYFCTIYWSTWRPQLRTADSVKTKKPLAVCSYWLLQTHDANANIIVGLVTMMHWRQTCSYRTVIRISRPTFCSLRENSRGYTFSSLRENSRGYTFSSLRENSRGYDTPKSQNNMVLFQLPHTRHGQRAYRPAMTTTVLPQESHQLLYNSTSRYRAWSTWQSSTPLHGAKGWKQISLPFPQQPTPPPPRVAGSIPDGVTGIFHWHNPSGRTMALGSSQPLTEMSTRYISLGVKAAGA